MRIKKYILRLWLLIPFGYICRFKFGSQTITLQKNLWLVVSDGESDDMLPLSMVSQQLVDECERQMLLRGYSA